MSYIKVLIIFIFISCNQEGGSEAPSSAGGSSTTRHPDGSLSISAPTKSIINSSGQSIYTITFDNITSPTLVNSDISIETTGTASGHFTLAKTGSNTYTITIDGGSGDGTIVAKVNASSNTDQNGSSLGSYNSSAITLDNTPPVFKTIVNDYTVSIPNKTIKLGFYCQNGIPLTSKSISLLSGTITGTVSLSSQFQADAVLLSNVAGDGSIYALGVDKSACKDEAGNSCVDQLNNPCGAGSIYHSKSFLVTSFSKVEELASGSAHHCARLANGKIKCWGQNFSGYIGYGHSNHIGSDLSQMKNNLDYISIGTGRSAKNIFAGSGSFTCALLDNNELKCWGDNTNGQLGIGNTNAIGDSISEMGDNLNAIDFGTNRYATKVAMGSSHACAILDNGSLTCWGNNSFGQLGLEHTDNRGDNSNEMGANLQFVNLGSGKSAVQIFAGSSSTCAILNDNSLKCWGNNDYGQLGQGHKNTIGGNSNEMGDNLNPIDLGPSLYATSVSIGTSHTCAILNNLSVKCWGRNNYGQLGQGDNLDRGGDTNEMGVNLDPIDFGFSRTVTQLTSKGQRSCAILSDTNITCWGQNTSAELGLGSNSPSVGNLSTHMGDNLKVVELNNSSPIIHLSLSSLSSCALSSNGTIKCWGSNSFGLLGQGRSIPTTIGNISSQMGANLPATILNEYEIK